MLPASSLSVAAMLGTRLFLRAEDVFGYTGRLTADMAELGEIEQELAKLPEGPGRDRAMGVARGQRGALAHRYGVDPDARSHGETFLALLQTRLVPNGLYFLDEPETPLSPTRVLALIAVLADRVRARLPVRHRHAFAHPAGIA